MKRMLLVSLAVCGLASTGCLSRGIKEGLGAVGGAKGVFTVLSGPTEALTSFDSIEVGTFTSVYGPTPGNLTGMIGPKLVEMLRKKGQPVGAPGVNPLLIRGQITYYETAPLTGQIFGPLEEAVAMVEFVDKSTGQVVLKAACVGRSNATTSMGVDSKAGGVAKAITDVIEKFRPTVQEE